MIYTTEQKKKLDAILKAFENYIDDQNYFDIVYSKKIGYVWIVVDEPGAAGAEQLDTPEAMLDNLFNDIINLYYSILDRADSIVYVSRAYHKNCMLERNRFLVDHAAALLAVYNGERRGGTAATMRYAQKMGREIITIDPATRLISHSNPVPEPTHS
ncbi:hypothetical protein D1841_03180 [Neglecta sp. X4]|uniref:DUF1273 domain-containing protein n=1 Tax=unclassified Neglectibacter TaxID=2632164 RepID=UPI00136C74BF|nr:MULTISPECIES: DUF1273 domain-containing protein [unclassified Neglectibacter]NBI16933.1 hypothetical protein [Neglectibacter sp. 59]NBJ72345.1 hypothetical protein [Neglectibacter sp. X4]NCE80120.1 hypothetical protein [Neglectibacter sp. X58]